MTITDRHHHQYPVATASTTSAPNTTNLFSSSSTSSLSDQDLLDQLERVAGVRPSLYWLNACRVHLLEQEQTQPQDSSSSRRNAVTPDALLYYILQSDLRDVVVRNHTNHNNSNSNDSDEQVIPSSSSSSHRHSLALRHAIQRSLTQPPYHQTIASSSSPFMIMCQVEELLDVSKNAQGRLELGPVAAYEPTPMGNQRHRCLKYYLSDGYSSGNDGSSGSNDGNATSEQQQLSHHATTPPSFLHLVAMEVIPIPHLSVHSKAGIKILLQGPMEVRHGVLLCHPGNTTVLGGQVPPLVQIQQAALLQAQRIAGIGVDATVRALIGTQAPPTARGDHDDDDDEEDVGEQESRDVVLAPVAAAIAPLTRTTTTGPPASLQHSRPNPSALQIPSHRPNVQAPMASHVPSQHPRHINNHSHHVMPAAATATVVASQIPSSRSQPPSSYQQQVLPPNNALEPRRQQPLSNVAMPPPFSDTATTTNSASRRNPYAAASTTRSTGALSSQPISHRPNSSTTTTTTRNHSSSDDSPTISDRSIHEVIHDHRRPMTGVTPHRPIHVGDDDDESPRSAIAIHTNTVASSSQRTQHAASTTNSQTGMGAPVVVGAVAGRTPSTSSGQHVVMTMTQLCQLLRTCCQDATLYQQQVGQIWIVSLQHYTHVDFNIEKRRNITKEEKKQGHKYDYVMTAKFGGPSVEDGLITCNVSNPILEPYFGYSPAEMRKMRREDRGKAQTIVAERGRVVATDLKALRPWQVTLCKSTDEFFQQRSSAPVCLDGKEPVLLILKQAD